jgi:hypothetical protein
LEITASIGVDSAAMVGNKGSKNRQEVQNRKRTEKLNQRKSKKDRWHNFLTVNGLGRRAGGRLER